MANERTRRHIIEWRDQTFNVIILLAKSFALNHIVPNRWIFNGTVSAGVLHIVLPVVHKQLFPSLDSASGNNLDSFSNQVLLLSLHSESWIPIRFAVWTQLEPV